LNNISFECVVSMQYFLINILFMAPQYKFLLCLTEKTIIHFPSTETPFVKCQSYLFAHSWDVLQFSRQRHRASRFLLRPGRVRVYHAQSGPHTHGN